MDKFFVELTGFAAGILTGVSMLPQLVKTIKKKEANGISILMLITLLSGLALWVVYGIFLGHIAIIATNAFSFCINTTLLFFRIRYRNR